MVGFAGFHDSVLDSAALRSFGWYHEFADFNFDT
jgi:hypothetical protein